MAEDFLTTAAAAWLENRGIPPETAIAYGVATATSRGGGSWLCFPTLVRGAVVGRQYRCIDRKAFSQQPGSRQTWWNGDAITDPSLADQPLIITEGRIDALSAIVSGFARSVSVPGGAPEHAGGEGNARYAFVADSLDDLRSVREIVLAVDGDRPGLNLLHDMSVRLGRGRCKFVSYPDGCKDLNDVLVRFGRDAVARTLLGARWCHVPGLFRMSDLPPAPYAQPHSTMIAGLHEHYRMRKADFTVVTGIPGSGKSTLVNDICCRMAHHHGWRTCFASFEQFPQVDHRRALRTWHSRMLERDMGRDQIAAADAWIDEHFSFVIPEEDADADLDWLLDKLSSAVIRYGADICVIDPWNEMDHARPRDVSLTEYVGHAIRQLKKFARKWDVHLIVVAHPAKLQRERDGKVPMPSLYDISDSAHFYNKPDAGLIIHPTVTDEDGEHSLLKVAKSRYHDQIGRPGVVKLRFDRTSSRFVWP